MESHGVGLHQWSPPQLFQKVIDSAGGRDAGRKSVPMVYATGNSAACVTVTRPIRGSFRSAKIAIPTTYAGSEVTSVWGLTEQQRKTTGRDPNVLPRAVVYDPELTLSLPAFITGSVRIVGNGFDPDPGDAGSLTYTFSDGSGRVSTQ